MDGFGYVIIALLVVAVFWFVIGMVIWMTFFKSGQRYLRKDIMKREVRRGMREAEIEDGLSNEVMREEIERAMRKKKRRFGW